MKINIHSANSGHIISVGIPDDTTEITIETDPNSPGNIKTIDCIMPPPKEKVVKEKKSVKFTYAQIMSIVRLNKIPGDAMVNIEWEE